MLVIIIDIQVLVALLWNNSIELLSNHVLSLVSHDVLLLPDTSCHLFFRVVYVGEG
jgi:hypothetical protein